MTDLSASRRRASGAKLGTAVVEYLVDDIVRGAYPTDASLPPEADLCEEFGVSRTVIRESIKVVQEKGLVRIEQGRGTSVNDPRLWNLLDDTVLTTVIRHDASLSILDELVSVRTALEAVMAADAARVATSEAHRELGAALARMEALRDNTPEFAAADVRFHDVVMAASGSRLGRTIVTKIHDKARTSMRYHGEYNETFVRLTLDEHRAIYDAIVAGDPDGAGAAMRAHIEESWRRRRPA